MMAQDPTPLTRPSLIIRIRDARDDAAWSMFLETYTPLIYGYCRRKGLQDSDASDVTQEVLSQVARTARGFEYQPQRGRFRDWLGTITRNKLIDHRRRGPGLAAGMEDGLEDAVAGDPGSDWADEFNTQVLKTALSRIEPDFESTTWEAFVSVWLRHESAPEVARRLGVPVESIYVAKSRVLKRLRQEIHVLADDLPLHLPRS